MNNKIAVITDSGANLSAQYVAAHPNLKVIPLMIVVGEQSFREQLEITPDEVYQKLDEHRITTSLPKLEDLESTLMQFAKDGYTDVLSISISSGLSGTFNAFELYFRDYRGIAIHSYDSKTLAGAQGQLVKRALQLINKNLTIEEIKAELNQLRYKDSLALYTINTLKYLKRGGRIGKVEGTIGDILHIKPVITVNDHGVYVTAAKSFGFNRALLHIRAALKEKFGETPIDLVLHYGSDQDIAKTLGEKLKREVNVASFEITQLTPVLGIHTGPTMLAVIASIAV